MHVDITTVDDQASVYIDGVQASGRYWQTALIKAVFKAKIKIKLKPKGQVPSLFQRLRGK